MIVVYPGHFSTAKLAMTTSLTLNELKNVAANDVSIPLLMINTERINHYISTPPHHRSLVSHSC